MPLQKEYSYTIESYFPPQFIALGVFGFAVAIALLFSEYWVFSFFIGGPSIIIAFTQRGTSLELSQNKIKKHFKVAGINITDETTKFTKVDRLCVRRTRISQRMNSRGSSSVVRYNLYKGFMIADGQARLITESKNQDYVMTTMEKLARELDTTLTIE